MAKTSLNDLRNHLFEVIERLRANDDPDASENEKITIENAKAIADISDVIVRSAKLEVDMLKAISFSQNPDMVERFMRNTNALLIEPKK